MRLLSAVLLLGFLVFLGGCGSQKQVTSKQLYLGMYQAKPTENPDAVRFKSPLTVKPHVMAWSADFSQPFPLEQCESFKRLGIFPMIRWEPWLWNSPETIQPADILAGKWDDYLQAWAQSIRSFKAPVLIAFAPDFNANRYPWAIQNQSEDPESYKALYRYVVSFLRKEGARNVIWVWSYLAKNSPQEEWNKPVLAYPGDDIVDWIGVGSVNEVEPLASMFRKAVSLASEQYAQKPIMITSFFYDGTSAGDKKLEAALTGPLSRVNAILLTNPQLLPKRDRFRYTRLFDADSEEFTVLHLGM